MKFLKKAGTGVCVGVLLFAAVANGQQVFSRNAVGVIRQALKPGLNLISTPLLEVGGAVPTLATIFGDQLPDRSEVHLFDLDNGYRTFTWRRGDWRDSQGNTGQGNRPVPRGAGMWVKNPSAEDVVVRIAGEVPADTALVQLKPGLQLISFAFPAERRVADAGLIPQDRDEIHAFSPETGYRSYTYRRGVWRDQNGQEVELVLMPGVAYWYKTSAERTWTQAKPYQWP